MKYIFVSIGKVLLLILKVFFIPILIIGNIIGYIACLIAVFVWSFKVYYFGKYRASFGNNDSEVKYLRHEPISRLLYRWVTLGPGEFPKKSYWELDYSYKGPLEWNYFKL